MTTKKGTKKKMPDPITLGARKKVELTCVQISLFVRLPVTFLLTCFFRFGLYFGMPYSFV
jgi:hypothetical protein